MTPRKTKVQEARIARKRAKLEAEAMERARKITDFFPSITQGDLSVCESLRSLIASALLQWRDKP